jgi:predicted ATP-grasp superfamily ATP-dependent carboligase
VRPAARQERPPVVVLGGGANALSVARSLGRAGVPVYAVNLPGEHVRYSRFVRWIDLPAAESPSAAWTEYLLGPRSDRLVGSVLLAASDAGLEIIASHREALARRFLLDESNPAAQLAMLNKLSTYRAATEAGVATPRFWLADSLRQVEAVREELVFPLIVKPKLSHLFEGRFGSKFFTAENYDALHAALSSVGEAGIEVVLMEKIPGGDDLLCSYYTYLDEQGEPLFDFTKRIIRRYPPGMGAACYHVTDRVPDIREQALTLFRHVGLRGLANVEFKLDPRDGRLKLIECNARFTAANCLVARAGFDLARFVYHRIVGLPQPPLSEFRSGLHLWYPIEDFRAFRTLRRRGEITWVQWLAGIARRQTFPFFDWGDPLPTLANLGQRIVRKFH